MHFEHFVKTSPVSKDLILNKDALIVFDYLSEPRNIINYITFSNLSLPALSGVVAELEFLYSKSPCFNLSDENNRKIVGRMLKYILGFYGYTPVKVTSSEKKFRNFSKANYFKTSAIYQKTITPKYKIEISSNLV